VPLIKSAIKKLRKDKKRTARNKPVVKKVKEKVKDFRKNPDSKKISEAYSVLDKALKAGVIKKNKANRLKSRLAKSAGKRKKVENKKEVKRKSLPASKQS